MNIELTAEQLKNLEVFLSRVSLTGAEVGAFQEIVRALITAKMGTNSPKKDGKVGNKNQ